MKARIAAIITLIMVTAGVGLAGDLGLDEVLANYYEARGGLEKLAEVDTVKITGTMSMPAQGMEAPFTWYWQRPNKLRIEFTVQGQTGVQAFDGETGWLYLPFMGKTEPEEMPDEQIDMIREQADFEGPLVGWEEKGHQVELLGKETAEGAEAYKLKLTQENGDVSFIYLDAEYFLELRQEGKRMVRGQEIEYETSSGDYKEVGGLMIPHSIMSGLKGAGVGQTITFETVELNVELEDGLFTMPETEGDDEDDASDSE